MPKETSNPDVKIARKSTSPAQSLRERSAQPGRVNLIVERATEVIGDKEKALRWMGTPVRALNYSTPVSLLGTEAGRAAVEQVLGRIEHGVF